MSKSDNSPFKRGDIVEYILGSSHPQIAAKGSVGILRAYCSEGYWIIDWVFRTCPRWTGEEHGSETVYERNIKKIGEITNE